MVMSSEKIKHLSLSFKRADIRFFELMPLSAGCHVSVSSRTAVCVLCGLIQTPRPPPNVDL